ncbi:MAG TPA: Mur ligase family protein [Candidatus Limnocylindrales bacterium]|nr:Mur ligase family protein [Candidatus Limnocylindrales bacterium]
MPRTYKDTLASLYALEAKKGMDFRLSRLDPVLDALDHPERAFRAVHIAGTNGKGSTAAMIESALRAGGYRTGLYTSPHLVSFRERTRIGGVPIYEDSVVRHTETIVGAASRAGAELTFFEIATLAAFLEMRERRVEIGVIEAGLGGRLDVTNVVHGDVAVLTSIGIDHVEFLGDTIAGIAAEKAAIIKHGATAVTGAMDEIADAVVAARVAEVGAMRLAWGRDFGPFEPLVAAQRGAAASDSGTHVLAGAHQAHNAALAAAAVSALAREFPVAPGTRDAAIVSARWPGRLEVLARRRGSGPVVLDAAHNPQAVATLAASLDAVAPSRPRVLVFAAMADKDWREMLRMLVPAFDKVIVTALPMARAERPESFLASAPGAVVASDPAEALERAEREAAAHGSIVVTGSIFLLGNLYRAAGGKLLEEDLAD